MVLTINDGDDVGIKSRDPCQTDMVLTIGDVGIKSQDPCPTPNRYGPYDW